MTATGLSGVVPGQFASGQDAVRADRAWRDGDTATAVEAADQALALGDDPGGLAAGVAAADGALLDAADRWRVVASALHGVPSAMATARAALTVSLAGDLEAAEADLSGARQAISGATPRGLAVLFDGVLAVIAATRGEIGEAARDLAGLAVAAVPHDPMSTSRWDDVAVAVVTAGGEDLVAWDMLSHSDRPHTTRSVLLKAWLDLRAGRLADARAGLTTAGDMQMLRRDAVSAAAVTIGLARRTGDDDALRATWHRVAPVVAGADVESLLLDRWGELSVGAALVSPLDADAIVRGMSAAEAGAGEPAWAMAGPAWWASQRAVVTNEPADADQAATRLEELVTKGAGGRWGAAHAAAARAWASTHVADIDPAAALSAATALADGGQPWEAAALCGAAAASLSEPAAVEDLLAFGRSLKAPLTVEDRGAVGGLSQRERAVGELMLGGLTQKEIGARLYISPKTVEQHVARLRQKPMATSKAELIAAFRAKITENPAARPVRTRTT